MVPVCLYDFANAAIVLDPKWQARTLKRGLHGSTLPKVVHANAAPCSVDEFRDADMSREFAKVVLGCYKADSNNLNEILSWE